MTLKEKYDSACNEYAKRFAKKQGLRFDYWIGHDDQIGSLASFSETYYFTMENIKLDIDRNIPKGSALKWHEDSANLHYTCQGDMNYFSYLMGKGLLKK